MGRRMNVPLGELQVGVMPVEVQVPMQPYVHVSFVPHVLVDVPVPVHGPSTPSSGPIMLTLVGLLVVSIAALQVNSDAGSVRPCASIVTVVCLQPVAPLLIAPLLNVSVAGAHNTVASAM